MTPSHPLIRRAAAIPAIVLALWSLHTPSPARAAVSRNVNLLAHLDNYNAYSACCAYVHTDGREYAVLGTDIGTSIVNITNPAASYEVGFIPGLTSVWREMKQYRNWVYISTEAQGGGIQIVRMADPEHPVLVKTYTTNFNRAHTVTVDTTRGLLILNGTRLDANATGMRILSLADPENPVEIGAYGFDYVHDSWVRGTTLYASCISSANMRVFDFTDPTGPVDIVGWTYPGARTHSAETSKDGRYLYVCDEQNYGTMKVFDMLDPLAHPMLEEITVNPIAIVHNVHVKEDTAFVAYYTEGVRLFDLSDPSLPAEWGYYDTYGGFSGGFHGVWDVAAKYPSGTFIASDIESGLYVFRSTPNYGTIKLRVLGPGSTPLSGADVIAVGEPDSTRTQGQGLARLALSPGGHVLRIKKFGYQSAVVGISMALGGHDSMAVTLPTSPTGSISGIVRRASDNAPLGDAALGDHDTPLEVTSDAAGAYSFAATPVGNYRIVCDRAGYAPMERIFSVQSAGALAENWSLLRAAWYDSCDTDRGWSLSAAGDNATDGLWTRAEPVGTIMAVASGDPTRAPSLRSPSAVQHPEPEEGGFSDSGPVQPDDDATPGTGFCFVTGNGAVGAPPANSDIDGGKTTLTSPAINISGMADPMIGFQRWYYMNTPGEPDSFLVDVSSDGVSWIRARTIRESHAEWHPELIRVKSYLVPGATVRIRFIAQDEGVGSVVEAAVDDIEVHDASLLPTPIVGEPDPAPPAVVSAPWPNPSANAVSISLRLADAAHARVAVYDVAGRLVAKLFDGVSTAGTLTVRWNGKNARGRDVASGVYWIHADAAGTTVARRVVLAR